MTELAAILQAVDSGGNAAMLVSIYFIWKCERRLARIEQRLQLPAEEAQASAK